MTFKPVKFSKKLIRKLINESIECEITELIYDPLNLSNHVWTELTAEGNWDATQESVKRELLEIINSNSKYLYNTKKYGERFFRDDDNTGYFYINMKDIRCRDWYILFKNKEE